jgi:hypothetical protein
LKNSVSLWRLSFREAGMDCSTHSFAILNRATPSDTLDVVRDELGLRS